MSKLYLKNIAFEEMEVLTVGLPFCFFKGLFGAILLRNDLSAAGYFFMTLGAVDLLINSANVLWLLAFRKRFLGTCFLNIAAGILSNLFRKERYASWRNIGSSLDVFFSFAIVAGVVGLGGLKFLSLPELYIWNLSVVLNVLGAGIGRMAETMTRSSEMVALEAPDGKKKGF